MFLRQIPLDGRTDSILKNPAAGDFWQADHVRPVCEGGGLVDISGLQCVAVCCSVLQGDAVCCSVSQCVSIQCSALQCLADHIRIKQVCCSVLRCVAMCCSALPMISSMLVWSGGETR